MWIYSLKNREKSQFWYKFAHKKKIRGFIEKLEYRRTTKNLPLCNGTITVLKITLFHSVSVITNFVIPKRKINIQKYMKLFSSTGSARPTIPTIIGTVLEEVRTIFASPNFFDPISSFAARSY